MDGGSETWEACEFFIHTSIKKGSVLMNLSQETQMNVEDDSVFF